MANAKDIKRRIGSVKNTQQITKAMKMVSASKLRRAQGSVASARPYKDKLKETLSRLVASMGDVISDPLVQKRDVKTVGFVVFSADRGLAGGYNANIMKKAVAEIKEAEAKGYDIRIMAIGRKAKEFFGKRGYRVDEEFVGLNDIPSSVEAEVITSTIREYYTQGKYDEIHIVYTEFLTAIQQNPKAVKLLPIETPAASESGDELDYIFEPSPEEVLSQILPLYLANQLFGALTEAKASEHGARMTAMSSATDNASELLRKLDLQYNRARQAAITSEISEIVSGAAALNG